MKRDEASPRGMVAAIEARPDVPAGAGDRFAGYGVLGVTFPSGDVLVLRRFPGSSVGPGYGSVWHHDRAGRWTVYQDVAPEFGCARYFGRGIDELAIAPIRIVWTDARGFSVLVDDGRTIEWQVELGASAATRLVGGLAGAASRRVWQALAPLTAAGTALLGAGRVSIAGRTPEGQRFLEHPVGLWLVSGSRAVINGRDSGEATLSRTPLCLGDVRIPRRGLFAVVRTYMHDDPLRMARASPGGVAPG